MKKITSKSKTELTPTSRKLTLKKEALKDLTASSKGEAVRGGGYTAYCGNRSVK